MDGEVGRPPKSLTHLKSLYHLFEVGFKCLHIVGAQLISIDIMRELHNGKKGKMTS